MFLIFLIICSIITVILFISDLLAASGILTVFLCVMAFFAFFGWIYYFYSHVHRKRLFLFSQKLLVLDRKKPKYRTLFILYDYIQGEENNIEVVKKAMEGVYFFPKRVTNHLKRVRRKELYHLLIEYYLSLNISKLKVSFVWNYNINFFTWKMIGITTLIGALGIAGLMICQHQIANPNDVLFTSLYFVFGAFCLPFIAKLFGHFI